MYVTRTDKALLHRLIAVGRRKDAAAVIARFNPGGGLNGIPAPYSIFVRHELRKLDTKA